MSTLPSPLSWSSDSLPDEATKRLPDLSLRRSVRQYLGLPPEPEGDVSASPLAHYSRTGEMRTPDDLAGGEPHGSDRGAGLVADLPDFDLRAPVEEQLTALAKRGAPPAGERPIESYMRGGLAEAVRALDAQGQPVDHAGQRLTAAPIQPAPYAAPTGIDRGLYDAAMHTERSINGPGAGVRRDPQTELRAAAGLHDFPTEHGGRLSWSWGKDVPIDPSTGRPTTSTTISGPGASGVRRSIQAHEAEGGGGYVMPGGDRAGAGVPYEPQSYSDDAARAAKTAEDLRTAKDPLWREKAQEDRSIAVAEAQARGKAMATETEQRRRFVISQAREKETDIQDRMRRKQLTPEQGAAMLSKLHSKAGEMLLGLEGEVADAEARKQIPGIYGQP
jgi:hypothetical protein